MPGKMPLAINPMNAKCSCQNCNGEFEFDVAEFQESNRIGNMIFGQNVPCPHCGKETSIYLEKTPKLPAALQSSPQTATETVFYRSDNIVVTNARFVIGTKTFAIRGVESVDVVNRDEVVKRPQRAIIFGVGYSIAFILMSIGFFFLIVSDGDNYAPMIIFGVISFIAVVIAAIFSNEVKRAYAIVLKTGSGEINAYKSFDQSQVLGIVRALNDSIISQG
jgi:hypothetical protein